MAGDGQYWRFRSRRHSFILEIEMVSRNNGPGKELQRYLSLVCGGKMFISWWLYEDRSRKRAGDIRYLKIFHHRSNSDQPRAAILVIGVTNQISDDKPTSHYLSASTDNRKTTERPHPHRIALNSLETGTPGFMRSARVVQ